MRNQVLFESDLSKVKKGMEIVHKAVTGTLGAAGKNIMFRDWTNEPVVTNDGYTIAEMINLEDEAERVGADFLKQASRRQNSEAGDGTSTVVSLAYAMIEKGLEKINKGVNAMRLKKQMDEAVKNIIPRLKKSARKIEDDKELFDVANLSMENAEMAKVVVQAIKSSGENGRVVVQESNMVHTEIEEVKGIQFNKGYISPYMISNPIKLSSEMNDVHVLIARKQYNLFVKQMLPLLDTLNGKGIRNILIICQDVIGEALQNLIVNGQQGKFMATCVQIPDDVGLLEDIALITGAQIIEENAPDELSPLHMNYLGKAKRVEVYRDKTIIDSNEGDKTAIKERIQSIKNEIKEKEKTGENVGYLKNRLAYLDGKSVFIKVGAPTQQEMKYLKLKIDDAVASASLSLKGGVVVGGGRALFDIGQGKPSDDGEDVVFQACMAPMMKIIENAREMPSDILSKLKEGQAWNSLTEKPVKDWVKEGILDPVDIEIWALKNAVSTAGMFLTTFGSIINVPEKKCNCGK